MSPYIAPDLTLLCVAGLFGLVVGSFLNVVILRWPPAKEREWFEECVAFMRELATRKSTDSNDDIKYASDMVATLPKALPEREPFNLVTPRSKCTACGHQITAIENIPVISYLWLKGRCSACSTHISIRYPLIELLTALMTVVVVSQLGAGLIGAAGVVLTWALIAAAFIDADTQLLPDDITLPFLWLGLFLNSYGFFTNLSDAVFGAIAGYLALWLVYQAFKLLTGKEGMGFGDFKLLAMLGAWLGWQQLAVIILLSSVVGAVIGILLMVFRGRDRSHAIPFGPYIAAAGWLAMLWGQDISAAYLRFSGLGPPY